jgi:hypothetical protein
MPKKMDSMVFGETEPYYNIMEGVIGRGKRRWEAKKQGGEKGRREEE